MKTKSKPIFAALCVIALTTGCGAKKDVRQVHEDTIPEVTTTTVKAGMLTREMVLPAEVLPYQDVPLYPKIPGFIEWIGVDRGSIVKTGQLMVRLIAPELDAQVREAQAHVMESKARLDESTKRLDSARAQALEADAKLKADDITFKRLKEAAQTPGVIAQNEVDVLEQTVEGDRALVASRKALVTAATEQVKASKDNISVASQALNNIKDMRDYLIIRAPFDGVITERNQHVGSFSYPPSGQHGYQPMLRIKENGLLRIVIPVPEIATANVPLGTPINFTVAAFPGRTFTGTVARVAHSLDVKTSTMPVELNFPNPGWLISPGMFPQVHWPMNRNYPTNFVPLNSVVLTLKDPFVIRIRNNRAERVKVRRGQTMGDLVEVFADLDPEDQIVLHASDELPDGAQVVSHSESKDPLDHGIPH